MFLVFFVYPVVQTVYISLTSWDGIARVKHVVGFSNYSKLTQDALFRNALQNTFVFMIVGGLILFPVALGMAWALHQPIRGRRFFRFIIFAPAVLSASVVAILWVFIYNPTFGLLDGLLGLLHLDFLQQIWLGDSNTALPAVIITDIWWGIGTWVILLSAGLERIPREIQEAARIDGANESTLWWRIILPLLWDVIRILIALWIIGSLQVFTLIFVMTQGGPLGATDVISTYLYSTVVQSHLFGYASAMAVVLLIIILVLTYISNRALTRETHEY